MSTVFSQILSSLRRSRGLSQRQVAEDLQVSQALLSHYENGLREPKFEFIIKTCDYYGVTADYLFGRSRIPADFSEYFSDISEKSARELNLVIAACADIFKKDAGEKSSLGGKYLMSAVLRAMMNVRLVPEELYAKDDITRAYALRLCAAVGAVLEAEIEKNYKDDTEPSDTGRKFIESAKAELKNRRTVS